MEKKIQKRSSLRRENLSSVVKEKMLSFSRDFSGRKLRQFRKPDGATQKLLRKQLQRGSKKIRKKNKKRSRERENKWFK